jgi:hypothetical protein
MVVLGKQADREGRVARFYKAEDPRFLEACEKVGIKATKRQASKWLAATGLAYKKGRS